MQNLNPPCPSWCDRLHGPNIPGTRHTRTVRDDHNMVVTATLTTGNNAVDVQLYNPEGPELYVIQADEAAIAGGLFTGHESPALDRLGRAFTAAHQAAIEAAAA